MKNNTLLLHPAGEETPINLSLDKLRALRIKLNVLLLPGRKEVVELLGNKKRLTVGELYKQLKIEQSVCSQYLTALKAVGLVTVEREGRQRYYSLVPRAFHELNAASLMTEKA